MKKLLVCFFFYTATCWALACIGYELLEAIMPQGAVFGRWYRMILYHYQHPYQYILLVAVCYGLTASLWAVFFGHLRGRLRVISICAVIAGALLLASVPGGLLWALHDIQAGFVPPEAILVGNLLWAAGAGLTFGWAILALSVPYNLAGLVMGCVVTHLGEKWLGKR